MSITEFENLITEIKLEVQEQNVNAVLNNLIKFGDVSRKTSKLSFEVMKRFIESKRIWFLTSQFLY